MGTPFQSALLCEVPGHICALEQTALRRLAPGPGNWISKEDLENLREYGLPQQFRTIQHTAQVAKPRLLKDFGLKRVGQQASAIRIAQRDSLQRPLGAWHYCSFAQRLIGNLRDLRDQGLDTRALLSATGDCRRRARLAIARHLTPYSLEGRVREKIARWQFRDPARLVTQPVVTNLRL